MTTSTPHRPAAAVRGVASTTTGVVGSADGTTIDYLHMGSGPGIVLLHGTMSTASHHTELAEALAGAFTVYVPDRRGRGSSGPVGTGYGVGTEVEDLHALLAATGSRRIFGVSSGGIIALHAALTLPSVERIAVFEPPLFRDRSVPASILARYEREMGEGRVAAALVTAMQGAQMGPAFFRAMPRRLSEPLTALAMRQETAARSGAYDPMAWLAPMLRYDLRLVIESSGATDAFRPIRADVLLVGGSRSPAYLKAALDDLHWALPHARRVELSGVDHAASWNADRGGRPGPVADELRRFFA